MKLSCKPASRTSTNKLVPHHYRHHPRTPWCSWRGQHQHQHQHTTNTKWIQAALSACVWKRRFCTNTTTATTTTASKQPIYLKDYKPPPYISTVPHPHPHT